MTKGFVLTYTCDNKTSVKAASMSWYMLSAYAEGLAQDVVNDYSDKDGSIVVRQCSEDDSQFLNIVELPSGNVLEYFTISPTVFLE